MTQFKRILCPVDLSETSNAAIELATTLAVRDSAKIAFLFVAPQWLPEQDLYGADYILDLVEDEKKQFEQIRPTVDDVAYEHLYLSGNPAPAIVTATESADMVVMGTHGRGGLMRLLMGSVAQYVFRNAKCPVFLVKGVKVSESADQATPTRSRFVSDVMHQVSPVHSFDKMDDVLDKLNKSKESAAPVMNDVGKCIGILTTTDIEKYRSLVQRFQQKDETVIDEMFEVDKYGQRKPTNTNFDQVCRHMTTELVSIQIDKLVNDASSLFEAHPKIHHLVVLDDRGGAVGIIDSRDVATPGKNQVVG
ncbi:MAG: universal stress protein A [Mariniblastus sp.]|jgi:universal stress protein A